MQPYLEAESQAGGKGKAAAMTSGTDASHALLRGCFELFRSTVTEIAKLSIETTNDLFEMDPLVTKVEIEGFRAKRDEWVKAFDAAMREFFERRLSGQRRKGRRPDVEESLGSLRLMDDADTSKQNALGDAAKRLAAAAKQELEALDYRISVLCDGPPSREIDNPFSPAYLLDAIGMTSRSLYSEPRIWRPLMERVIGDFAPAVNQTYVRLNRFLAERGVLPEIGASLRARSDLRPIDDRQLLPVFGRLLNDVHASLQGWHTIDSSTAACYRTTSLAVNPYLAAVANVPRRSTLGTGGLPRGGVVVASPALSPVLETLDYWQHVDPMSEHLRSNAPEGLDAGATPVNRIPWIHAAIAAQVTEESARSSIGVVGFLFDYIFRDSSIPPRFRMIFDALQVPILKVALVDPSFFADKTHAARRLIDTLADAAIGADDDDDYGKALETLALSIVAAIGKEFVLDADAFERGCHTLNKFIDGWQKQVFLALQPYVGGGLAAESCDTEQMQVRMLIRDKLAGADVSFDVRAFVGTVWADYLTRLRMTDGADGDSYAAAVKTIDDMLWSILAKERTSQKARLSKMIPPLVRSLRAGGAAAQVADEKMKRFLDTLYALHIAAIKPGMAETIEPSHAASPAAASMLAEKPVRNFHDFVADIVLGTWFAFDKNETRVKARLSWISPLRFTYVFITRSGLEVMVFTPEELAWELSTGEAALILEPVPLFDRAISDALEFLAEQKAKRDAIASQAAVDRPLPGVVNPALAMVE